MSRWKRAEKEAAEAFGVKRNIRVNWGEEGPDTTEHPIFAIEVKSMKKISQFILNGLEQALSYWPEKIPVLVLKPARKDSMVLMKLRDFEEVLHMIDESRSGSGLDAVLEIEPTMDGKVRIKVIQ